MIGDKIKNLRKEYKLTQGELAEKIGTQQPQVTRWENGRKIPCLDALKKISQIFNISLDTLVFTEKDLPLQQNLWVNSGSGSSPMV